MTERNWHVVFTMPGKEKKVADLLAKKKIDCYLPVNNPQADGRKKTVTRLLFPRYLFVAADCTSRNVLDESRHILNFVYWQNQPVRVQNTEIEAIRNFLNEYTCTRLDKTAVMPDSAHRVDNEMKLLRKGNVIEANITTVRLTLPTVGYILVAEVRKEKTEEVTHIVDSMMQRMTGS